MAKTISELAEYGALISAVLFQGYVLTGALLIVAWFLLPRNRIQIQDLIAIAHSILLLAAALVILYWIWKIWWLEYLKGESFYKYYLHYLKHSLPGLVLFGFFPQILWIKKIRRTVWIMIPLVIISYTDPLIEMIFPFNYHHYHLTGDWMWTGIYYFIFASLVAGIYIGGFLRTRLLLLTGFFLLSTYWQAFLFH